MTRKPLSEAAREKNRASVRRYQERNRERLREIARHRTANDPAFQESRQRAQQRYRKSAKGKRRRVAKYGLTRDQYETMYAAQSGRCTGCCRSFEALGREPDIDHDHRTGQVRGLLCHSCNLILGLARDEVSTLLSLVKHLEDAMGVFA